MFDVLMPIHTKPLGKHIKGEHQHENKVKPPKAKKKFVKENPEYEVVPEYTKTVNKDFIKPPHVAASEVETRNCNGCDMQILDIGDELCKRCQNGFLQI